MDEIYRHNSPGLGRRPTPSALDGALIKLRQAQSHIGVLEAELADGLAGVRFIPVYSGHSTVAYRVEGLPDIDPQWSAIVGDILHNLRSALDYLAWQLVHLDGLEPTTSTQFPIKKAPPKKGRPLVEPALRSAEIVEAFAVVQPYHRWGSEDPDLEAVVWSPLYRLAQLNNADKHRTLRIAVWVLDLNEIYWDSDKGDASPACTFRRSPCLNGDTVATFDFRGAGVPESFDPHLVASAVLRDDISGSEVVSLLRDLHKTVSDHLLGWPFGSLFHWPWPRPVLGR